MVTRNSWNSEDPAQVSKGGTGLATITDHAVMVGSAAGAVTPIAMNTNGMLLIGSNGADPVAATLTQGSGITITNGAGTITIASSASGSGIMIQQVTAQLTATTTISTTMPIDNTIPQKTEGTEVLTLSITPTNASNYLLIEFNTFCSLYAPAGGSGVYICSGALFQDDTSNALSATILGGHNVAQETTEYVNGSFKHKMVAGTTSATTFKIRVGKNSATPTVYVNPVTFGDVASTWLTITEIKV